MHEKMSLHGTPGSTFGMLKPAVSKCSKHTNSVSDPALAASGWMQTYGYKKVLRIAAVKQTVYGSLGHLKVYLFILKSIPGQRNYAAVAKSIYSCLTKAGGIFMGSLFACFFKQVSLKSGCIATDGESHYRNTWSIFSFVLKV